MSTLICGFPGGAMLKNPPASAGDKGDMGLNPRSEISPGEGNGNLFQYSCQQNAVDRQAWRLHSIGLQNLHSIGLQRVRHN